MPPLERARDHRCGLRQVSGSPQVFLALAGVTGYRASTCKVSVGLRGKKTLYLFPRVADSIALRLTAKGTD